MAVRAWENPNDNISIGRLLTSEPYRLYLQRLVRYMAMKDDLYLIFSNKIQTDFKFIQINPLHKFTEGLTLEERTLINMGMLAHEYLHIMFTDPKTLDKVWGKYGKTSRGHAVKNLFNITEDGAIELTGVQYYEGTFGQGIMLLNEQAFKYTPSMKQLVQKNIPEYTILETASLQYIVLGQVKGVLPRKLKPIFLKATDILDKGRVASTSWGRLNKAEDLFKLLEPYWEKARKNQQKMPNFYPKNSNIPQQKPGQSQPQTQPMPSQIHNDPQRNQQQQTKNKLKQELQEQEGKDENKSGAEGTGAKQEDQDKQESKQGGANSSDRAKKDNEGESKTKKDKDKKEKRGASRKNSESNEASVEVKDSNPSFDTKEGNAQQDNGTSRENEKRKEREEALDNLKEQLENVKGDYQKEVEENKQKGQLERQLQEQDRKVDLGSLHNSIRIRVKSNFPAGVQEKIKYQEEFRLVRTYANNMTRQLLEKLKYQYRRKQAGKYYGNLNQGQLYRDKVDQRHWYRKSIPVEKADLAVLVTIDESGSMSGRIKQARLASMVLQHACHKTEVPLSIVGHRAQGGSPVVDHRYYTTFERSNDNDKYHLANMDTGVNTREGLSLKVLGDYLVKRSERDKLLIAISDGVSAHGYDRYRGNLSQRDCRAAVIDLEKKGIMVIGLAIGPQSTEIAKIYNHCLEVEDVSKLSNVLMGLLNRYLFK